MHKQKKTGRRLILALCGAIACFAGALHMDGRNSSSEDARYTAGKRPSDYRRRMFRSKEVMEEPGLSKRRRPTLAQKAAERYEIMKLIRKSQEQASEPVADKTDGTVVSGSLMHCAGESGCSLIISTDIPLLTVAMSSEDFSMTIKLRVMKIDDQGITFSAYKTIFMSERISDYMYASFDDKSALELMDLRIRPVRRIGNNAAGIMVERMIDKNNMGI